MTVKDVIALLGHYPHDKEVKVLDSWGDEEEFDIDGIYTSDDSGNIIIKGDF